MRRALSALAFALVPVAAHADIPVSPLGDIYETYNDCLKIASKDGLSKKALTSLGWSRAEMKNGDGKPVVGGPIIYGNLKRKPIIILSAERGEGICIVMARIETAATFADFLKAWGNALPAPDKDGTIGFYDEGHAVLIRQTGTNDKPALTMSVMTPSEKK